MVKKRNKFWQDNQEVKSNAAPQKNEYNKKKESDEYWSKVNADEEAQKKAQQATKAQAPSRPAPGKGKLPPQHIPEPAYEEPTHEEQPYEEPVQTYEEPAHVEQPYEEPVQTYEEPVQTEEPQTYEEPAQEVQGQQAKALYDYAGEAEGDLAFATGDIIAIHDTSDPGGWWQGELNGVIGVFPSNFVEMI